MTWLGVTELLSIDDHRYLPFVEVNIHSSSFYDLARGVISRTGVFYPPGELAFPLVSSGVRVAQYIIFCLVLCGARFT